MSQNELMVDVLRQNLHLVQMTLADFSDADMLKRPAPSANNALWQLGHLITSEAHMVNQGAGKTVIELPAGFADRYKRETAAVNDPAKLGTKAELLALLEKGRASACAWFATLTPADMAKPSPESMRAYCPTIGHIAPLFPSHACMHLGQIQVLRRTLGKPVLF